MTGKYLVAGVGQVAGGDGAHQQQGLQVGAGELDQEAAVAHPHVAEVGAVDDGRERQRAAGGVLQVRERRQAAHDVAVVPALGMLVEDLGQRQLVLEAERHEAGVRRRGAVAHRPDDVGAAVDAHGDGAAALAVAVAQLFLGLNQLQQQRLAQRWTGGGKRGDAGPDILQARIHVYRALAGRGRRLGAAP